jgi:hypothetical protein
VRSRERRALNAASCAELDRIAADERAPGHRTDDAVDVDLESLLKRAHVASVSGPKIPSIGTPYAGVAGEVAKLKLRLHVAARCRRCCPA